MSKRSRRGGRRKGAGRKSLYPGKRHRAWMRLTRDGHRALRTRQTALGGVTRNDAIEDVLRAADVGGVAQQLARVDADPFPGKDDRRLTILLTPSAWTRLRRLQGSTGRSAGVIVESLLRASAA
jgi:hypothetical protein